MRNRIRSDWDDYFMKIAYLVSDRSTCLRRKVGAVAVRDRHILSTGYNGAPAGLSHCLDTGCIRDAMKIPSGERHELCRAVHAEQNVIIQAARYGASLDGSTLYCTTSPCLICAKMLINVGVLAIIVAEPYPDGEAQQMLLHAGIEIRNIE